ncbi:MAG TPA: cupin domain-containing protein [Oscillatoriaceae cyanobacterium]
MPNSSIRLAAGALLIACLAPSIPGGTPWARFSSNAWAQSTALPKKGFVDNIDRLTLANQDYRRVFYTGQHLQLVLMSLKPGEEIGAEAHRSGDQFFRVEAGEGEIVINGVKHHVSAGFAMIVPAGARHNVRNTGTKPLKLYTLYAPPEHRRDVEQRTKADAEREHEHFDGNTSEE